MASYICPINCTNIDPSNLNWNILAEYIKGLLLGILREQENLIKRTQLIFNWRPKYISTSMMTSRHGNTFCCTGPLCGESTMSCCQHNDVIKWKHFPHYWPFRREIHRSPVNSLHKGQWSGALMFSLICAWTNSWANHQDPGDLRRHRACYDVIVMKYNTHIAYTIAMTKIDHQACYKLTWNTS